MWVSVVNLQTYLTVGKKKPLYFQYLQDVAIDSNTLTQIVYERSSGKLILSRELQLTTKDGVTFLRTKAFDDKNNLESNCTFEKTSEATSISGVAHAR